MLDTEVLSRLIGLRDLSVVSHADTEDVQAADGAVTWRRREYQLDSGDRIPALVHEPTGNDSHGIVLALHQHNNEYAFGKSEAAGISGYPHAGYGLELARAGFTVICPDFPGFEERRYINDQADEFLAAMTAITTGGTLHGRMVSEVLAVARYVNTNKTPDQFIGVVGHSLGGQVAVLAGVLGKVISRVAISAGVTTVRACMERRIQHNPGWYIPNVLRYGDYPALAPLFAGKDALFVAHTADDYFPAAGTREFFEALPQPGIQKGWFEQGHAMSKESLATIVRWFAEGTVSPALKEYPSVNG